MLDYRITKEECEIQHAGSVCSRCGKPIQAMETVDNAENPTHWGGCPDCGYFDSGVDQQTFDLATILYDITGARPCFFDGPMNEEHARGIQVNKLCDMVRSVEAAQKIYETQQKP